MTRLLLAALVVVAVSCSADAPDERTAAPDPPPATGRSTAPAAVDRRDAALGDVRVRLAEVAAVSDPTALAVRTGDDALYVTERGGRVVAVGDGGKVSTVGDLSRRIQSGGEQGLLGLAFSPDGEWLYVDYTDRRGDTRVAAVDMATRRRHVDLLVVPQPYPNHNGGQLQVRPDGTLWIGLGDGGASGDPEERAQDLGDLLGKILRIQPTPDGPRPYTVPRDNPFVGREGARPEIWAYGLRNPWRFTFDRETGDLWIGDVGQNDWEEVSFEPAGSGGGRNYGWDRFEGSHRFEGSPPPDAVPPILEYSHADGGVAVTGGYVYRGSRIPDLVGAYVYADYAIGEVWAARQSGGRATETESLGVSVGGLSSFGEDADGELYVLSLEGAVYRLEPA